MFMTRFSSPALHRSLVVLCALALPISAVINTNSEPKVERREAYLTTDHKPFDTYGPPPISPQPVLPTPVYGAPAIGKYPLPPAEKPPSQEYGIPVLKYGRPKVHVEYGPPQAHSHQQSQIGNHHYSHQVTNHGSQNSISFLDQIKQSFGFGSAPSNSYGPPPVQNHQPHSSYGPPPSVNHFLPPKPHVKYGPPPTKPHFNLKPPTAYGPPKHSFAPPKQNYGLPLKPAVNFKPQQTYGPPQHRAPQQSYGPPSQHYAPPAQHFAPPAQQYGAPPSQQYGPPPQQHGPSPVQQYGPPPRPVHGAGCDGWKPIPGPSIGIQQTVGHSNNVASIQSVIPENTYLPPPSNNLPLADLQVHPLPTNPQLPVADAPNFHHAALDHLQQAGFGLTNINVVKSEGIELHSNNLLDSYSAPPADSFAPNHQQRLPIGLTPPNSFSYSIPSHGLGIQPITGHLRQFPPQFNYAPPKQPIRFREPVPQGLIQSIGQSVLHQDTFGVKLNQQQNVYLPPPSNEIPPPPQGLETLPLAPAAPFHSHQPKTANLFNDQYLYASTQQTSGCSHGPNLANSQYISQSIPQLQTVYGIPPQPLDVSSSSSFEIAQNAAQSGFIHSSYEAPASGSATSIDALLRAQASDVNAPASSYGPPPSGNPADNQAHGSQKSVSTVEIDSTSNVTTNDNGEVPSDASLAQLPGLSSAGLDIISAQKSKQIELPVQGQQGSYDQLQFQYGDLSASQNNELDRPNHGTNSVSN